MAQNEQQKKAAEEKAAAEKKAAEEKAAEEKAAAEKKAAEEKAAEEKAAAEKKAAEKPDWVVAEGKSITSKKGILAPGDEVKIAYLSGGEKSFAVLKKQKIVVKG